MIDIHGCARALGRPSNACNVSVLACWGSCAIFEASLICCVIRYLTSQMGFHEVERGMCVITNHTLELLVLCHVGSTAELPVVWSTVRVDSGTETVEHRL